MSLSIRKELEAGIAFQGAVHCMAAGLDQCCFTCDHYLYVWPLYAAEPMPAFELPFVPATISLCEATNSLLVVGDDSVVLLLLGDGISVLDSAIAAHRSSMFPMVSGSCFSPAGHLACAYSGTADVLKVVSGLGPSDGDETDGPAGMANQWYSVAACTGDIAAAKLVIECATFGSSHLYLATKNGSIASIPIGLFEGSPTPEEEEVIHIPSSEVTYSRPVSVLVSEGGLDTCITALRADSSDAVVYVGLDDGTVVLLAGPAHPTAAPFSLLLVVDVKAAIAFERLKDSSECIAGDTSNLKSPVIDMALMGDLVTVVTPLGVVFLLCGGGNGGGHDGAPQVSLVHLELSTSGGDGIAAASVLGDSGASLSWHAFSKSIVLRVFTVVEGEAPTAPGAAGVAPTEVKVGDDEDDEQSTAMAIHSMDEDPTRMGWASTCSTGTTGPTPAPHQVPSDTDIIRASIALGPKYTAQLQVKGLAATSTTPKPASTTRVAPKPAPKLFSRPQTLQTKPVTFGKAIKGSGYGASSNQPWSVQQAQQSKKFAAAAKAKKGTIALGADPPTQGPSVAGGLQQFLFDVQKSTAPVVPKAKSNEVLSKPENKVHTGAITSLVYNSAATAIITGSTDCTLHLLRCPVATHKGDGKAARGHSAPVLSVAVGLAAANPLVVSGSRDGCIGVWCPAQREAPFIMENVAGPKDVTCAKFFYQDRLIAAAVGSQLKFFRYAIDLGGGDLDRMRNLSRLSVADQYRTDAQAVTSLDCVNSFLSTIVAWSGSNRQLGVVDIGAQRTVRQTEDAHTRAIHSVVLAATASRYASPPLGNDLMHCCATAAIDKTVKLWDLRVPGSIQTLSSHMNLSQQVGLCFSPCGRFVVVGSEDRSAFVYDVRAGGNAQAVARLPMPDVVTACSYHPLEPVVALGTASGDIRMFGV